MSTSFVRSQASEDFTRARNKALFNDLQNFFNPDKHQLLSFNDVKAILKPRNEVYAGMQAVPIQKIVGSEGRYQDFDSHFLPKNKVLRQRWERVDRAHLTDIVLPPIQLYELGGLYFVRDGNHRVSVAKAQGVAYIDAEVISLKSEIFLKPDITTDTLLSSVIEYEKRIFYAETGFGDLTENWELNFTTPGQYNVIYNHILVHKYYINESVTTEIPITQALLSWYENVFMPVVTVIREYTLCKHFKNRTEGDIYVWIVKQWDDLKRKYGVHISLEDVTKSMGQKERTSVLVRIAQKVKNLFQT